MEFLVGEEARILFESIAQMCQIRTSERFSGNFGALINSRLSMTVTPELPKWEYSCCRSRDSNLKRGNQALTLGVTHLDFCAVWRLHVFDSSPYRIINSLTSTRSLE